jgi:hypothetical protein
VKRKLTIYTTSLTLLDALNKGKDVYRSKPKDRIRKSQLIYVEEDKRNAKN